MKEPVDHIMRPRLPWREGEVGITECGFDASKVKTLTRDGFFARKKEIGSRRSAMLTCITCSDTAERHGDWKSDPRMAMQREITWEHGGGYYACKDRGERLKNELLAIEELIKSHHDEFYAAVDTIQKRRAWLQKKEERKL